MALFQVQKRRRQGERRARGLPARLRMFPAAVSSFLATIFPSTLPFVWLALTFRLVTLARRSLCRLVAIVTISAFVLLPSAGFGRFIPLLFSPFISLVPLTFGAAGTSLSARAVTLLVVLGAGRAVLLGWIARSADGLKGVVGRGGGRP